MATTTINNPRMSFEYYFLDNSSARRTHWAETKQEAIDEAKRMTNGRSIEICPRYGLSWPVAIVEPDGQIIQGDELREIRKNRG